MIMTTLVPGNDLLIEAVDRLISDYAASLPSADVLAAVARAQIHVRDGLGALRLDMPPDDEYAMLVTGLARQELAVRTDAVTIAPRPRRP
jgi:hypothetical protein